MPTARHTLGIRRAKTNEISSATPEEISSIRPAGTRRLPPLAAIHAFEAAARHMSFNRAAEELRLTASAVSHRIRVLEEFLGVALFHRLTRQVVLTPAGEAYLEAVGAGLERIAAATAALRGQGRARRLTVSVAPVFASRLMQRLPDFHRAHPEVEICVIASTRFVDFSAGEADIAIRYGSGSWPNLVSHYLQGEESLPVCSPKLLRGRPPLKRAADLKHFTLLHVLCRPDDWRGWLEQERAGGLDLERGAKFQTSMLALEAAAGGMGVAIVERELAEGPLQQGQLIAPFASALRTEKNYFLVYPRRRRNDKATALFRDWMLDRFAQEGWPRAPQKKSGAPSVTARRGKRRK